MRERENLISKVGSVREFAQLFTREKNLSASYCKRNQLKMVDRSKMEERKGMFKLHHLYLVSM